MKYGLWSPVIAIWNNVSSHPKAARVMTRREMQYRPTTFEGAEDQVPNMTTRTGAASHGRRLPLILLPVAVLLAAFVPILLGTPAGASPRPVSASSSCPTDPYTQATVQPCNTTTT